MPAEAPALGSPAVYLVAAVTVLVLGLNWPIMGVGVGLIPPMWLTAIRLLGAGVLVGSALLVTGRLHRPDWSDYPILASVAVMRLALVYSLVFIGLSHVPPGRSFILVYTSALWTAPLAAWLLKEHLTVLRLVGVGVGATGVVILVQPWSLSQNGDGATWGFGLLLMAAFFTAAGTVHIRGHRWTGSALALMPWQLTAAGVLTTVVALVVEGLPSFPVDERVIGILLYQVVLASAFGVWGLLTIARSLPAVSASLLLMAVPVIGLLSSAVLVDEPLTLSVMLGMLLVLGGVAAGIVTDATKRPSDPSAAP